MYIDVYYLLKKEMQFKTAVTIHYSIYYHNKDYRQPRKISDKWHKYEYIIRLNIV